MNDPKRRLLLGLRRRLHVHRRFDLERLEPSEDGAVREICTCRSCGKSVVYEYRTPDGKPLKDNTVTNGVTGECPTCTERERDKRYPLTSR